MINFLKKKYRGLILVFILVSVFSIIKSDITYGISPGEMLRGTFGPILEFMQPSGQGVTGARQFLVNMAQWLRNVTVVIAIVIMVIIGIRIITSHGDEAKIKNYRMYIIYSILGMFIMNLSYLYVSVVFGEAGAYLTPIQYIGETFSFGFINIPSFQEGLLEKIILPVLLFFETLAVGIAFLFLILSAVQMISAGGKDDKIKKYQSQIIWSVLGLIVILLAHPFVVSIFNMPETGMSETIEIIANIINFVLGFVFVVALVVLVYAGVLYIANFGNDEMVTRAKKMMLYDIIGILVIIFSYTISTFFILNM